jgi:DUF971 family protein
MTPINITLNQKSRILEIVWPDEQTHQLPCEYLRVFSPSAEVQGHGPGQETLQLGKENINITAIEPVGNYAIKLVFDDNHDSGLFDWGYLRNLGENQKDNWKDYLRKCEEAGYERKQEGQVI